MRRLIGCVLAILLLLVTSNLCPSADEFDDFWSVYQYMICNLHLHTKDSRTPLVNAHNIGDVDHLLAESVRDTIQDAINMGVHSAVTDHDCKTTLNEWYAKKQIIDQFCNEGFPTLRGFEWTSNNHLNILNSQDLVTVFDVGAEGIRQCKNLDSLLDWLASQPDDVVVQFNHPTMNKQYFDFAKVARHAAKDHFRLIEVGSGPTGFYSHICDNLPQLILALQARLHCGVAIGADNFGSPGEDMARRHTTLWVTEYSRGGMIETIKSCRTYASEDRDIIAKYHIVTQDQGGNRSFHAMGSIIDLDDKVNFGIGYHLIDPTDPSPRIIDVYQIKKTDHKVIRIMSHGQKVLVLKNSYFSLDDLKNTICFFLYIEQEDGDQIVTSPVWINFQSAMFSNYRVVPKLNKLQELSYELKENQGIQKEIFNQESITNYSDIKLLRSEACSKFNESLFYPLNPPQQHFSRTQHQYIYLFFDIQLPDNLYPQPGFNLWGEDYVDDIARYFTKFLIKVKKINSYQRIFIRMKTNEIPPGKYTAELHLFDGNNQEIDRSIFIPPTFSFYLH